MKEPRAIQSSADSVPAQMFLDAAPQAIMLTDTDIDRGGPTITYVNAAFERMTGWPAADILGKTPRVLQGPDTDRGIFADLRARLATGERWHGETVNYRRDGQSFIMAWSITPIRDQMGAALAYMAVQEDVTERRSVEIARAHLQCVNDRLMQAASEGILMLDGDGRITHASRAAAEMFNVSQGALLAQPASQFLDMPEKTPARVMARRSDGQVFPVAMNSISIDGPAAPGRAVMIRDLTQLVAQRESLDRETARLRTAQRIAQMGSWDYDAVADRIEIAEDALETFDLDPMHQACAPETFLALVHPGDVGTVRAAFAHALAAAETYSATYRLRTRTGERVVHAVGEIRRAPDGSLAGMTGVAQDITRRADQERRLLEALSAAEAANAAKSRFLATISHELRTPLNAINGFSEIMTGELFGPLGNAAYRDYASEILASGRHLLSLIEQVLDFTAVEAGTLKLHEDLVLLEHLVPDVARACAGAAQSRGIELVTDTVRVPPLRGDNRLLRQAVAHLVHNAVKFAPEETTVMLSVREEANGCIAIRVRDQGPGIEDTDMTRALAPFEQLNDHLARHQGGIGVGLHLVQTVATVHGGELGIHRRPEGGTDALLRLPADRVLSYQIMARPD
jgi:PAS domain S-box-containing protein